MKRPLGLFETFDWLREQEEKGEEYIEFTKDARPHYVALRYALRRLGNAFDQLTELNRRGMHLPEYVLDRNNYRRFHAYTRLGRRLTKQALHDALDVVCTYLQIFEMPQVPLPVKIEGE